MVWIKVLRNVEKKAERLDRPRLGSNNTGVHSGQRLGGGGQQGFSDTPESAHAQQPRRTYWLHKVHMKNPYSFPDPTASSSRSRAWFSPNPQSAGSSVSGFLNNARYEGRGLTFSSVDGGNSMTVGGQVQAGYSWADDGDNSANSCSARTPDFASAARSWTARRLLRPDEPVGRWCQQPEPRRRWVGWASRTASTSPRPAEDALRPQRGHQR